MALREMCSNAIQTAKNLRMQGGTEEREGKLRFNGTVQTQDEANKIWDAIGARASVERLLGDRPGDDPPPRTTPESGLLRGRAARPVLAMRLTY